MPKQTIKDILEYFREEARNNRDLGDKFERLIAAFLTKDPYYANHFSDVWLWMEWPGRNNMGDTRGNPAGGAQPIAYTSARAKLWFREQTTWLAF